MVIPQPLVAPSRCGDAVASSSVISQSSAGRSIAEHDFNNPGRRGSFFFCHLTLILLGRERQGCEREKDGLTERRRSRAGRGKHGEGRALKQEEGGGAWGKQGKEEAGWEPGGQDRLQPQGVGMGVGPTVLPHPDAPWSCVHSHQARPIGGQCALTLTISGKGGRRSQP